jgi:hydrogenase small subunit
MSRRHIASFESQLGVTRREFLGFCTGVAATLGLGSNDALAMAEALASPKRPSVIWLHGQDCTACSETLLRSEHPTLDSLILRLISLDYHETLAAAAGHQVEAAKKAAMEENRGRYLLVVEGSVPTRDGGSYCKIGNQTMVDLVKEGAEHAGAIVAIGSCATWGGIPSATVNPTGAKGIGDILPGKPVVNIPGCPPNPYNFLATVLHYVTFGRFPALDAQHRPEFAYGRLIHDNCERRAHFDAGRFAVEFGDEGHRQGWCLYKLGCKGPMTHGNCASIQFNDLGGGTWPVGIGHPCFGCIEHGVGFTRGAFQLSDVDNPLPPTEMPTITERQEGSHATLGAAALIGAGIGATLGVAAMAAGRLKQNGSAEGRGGEKS